MIISTDTEMYPLQNKSHQNHVLVSLNILYMSRWTIIRTVQHTGDTDDVGCSWRQSQRMQNRSIQTATILLGKYAYSAWIFV